MNDLRAKVNSKGPAGERISIPIIVFVNKGVCLCECARVHIL